MPTVEFQGTLHEFPDTFTDDQIGSALKRHAKGENLRGQQTQARGELLPRLAGMMPAPDAPQEPTRPQYQPSSFVDIAGENRVRPQFELPKPPRLSALDAARGLDMLAAGAEMQESAVAGQPQTLAGAEERLARDVTPGLGSKIVAGVQQTAAGLADPEAIALMGATAGMGVLPKVLQRIGSGTFAAWMAANAGQPAAELEQAIKDDDVEAAARATAGLGIYALFAGLAAKHSLAGIAKNSPRIAGWLSKKVAVADIPPAEVKAAYNRLERGMGTEADANLVRMVNESFDRPGQAFREGVTVEESSPRIGPAFRDWLGVPEATGGRTVRLRDGREVVVNEETGGTEFPAPPSPIVGRGERAGVRSLLRDAELPPEQLREVAPTLNRPRTVRETPEPSAYPEPLEGQPYDTRLENRPEAAMETLPSARWTPDAPREPAVKYAKRPDGTLKTKGEYTSEEWQAYTDSVIDLQTAKGDLADTIAALRAGYRPEVEVQQTPVPERFNSVAELLAFRSARLAEEVALYQREIGLTNEEAVQLQNLMAREADTDKFEKRIGAEKAARLNQFFDESAFNKVGGPFEFWETDRRLNPESVAGETDKELLASALVSAVQRGIEAKATSDRFLTAAIAARQLKEVGGTLSDVAKYLDAYTTRESSSQGDKLEFFTSLGAKVNAFLSSQGVNLPEGDLSRRRLQPAPPAQPAAQPGVATNTVAERPSQPSGGQSNVAQPAAAAKAKRVRAGTSLMGRFNAETERMGPDILDFIIQSGGMLSKAAAKAKGVERWKLIAPEYDDARTLAVPHHNLIYRGLRTPDKVAQAAYEKGLLSEASVPELWQAISDASRRRHAGSKNPSREEKFLQAEAAAAERWSKATESGKLAVTNEQLGVGDVLDVEGVKVEVTERDPETGRLTLQDGREFETQFLEDGQTIYVEAWVEKTPEKASVVDDWDTADPVPAAKPIEQPKPSAPKVEDVPKNRQAEAAVSASLAPEVRDLNGQPTGWHVSKNQVGVTLVSPDGKQMVKFHGNDASSGSEVQRQYALAQVWAIENPLRVETPRGELVVKPVFDQPAPDSLTAAGVNSGDRVTVSGGNKFNQDVTGTIAHVLNGGRILEIVRDGDFTSIRVNLEDYKKVEKASAPASAKPAAQPKPRKFTEAEASEYTELEDKRRAAQEGGERLSVAEAKRYAELTAIAGQQELLAESGASSNAGRVATLEAKLAEVERLEGMARKRLYASKSGSNARELTMAEVRGYETEAARLRAEIDTLKNGPKAAAAAEPDLFGGSASASASPMPARAAAVGSPPPLGGPPPLPHEEPSFSALPLGMPELVDLYKSLSAGQYPKVVQAIARLPWAAGVFRHQDATGVARVELLAKLFKLLTPEEEAALLAQAREYAKTVAQPGDNLADLVRERYQMLLKQALEEAKRRGPVRAQQVLAHEIMHWIDWVPDHTLKRGNILGHIAAFKDSWLKHWLARDPAKPHGKPLTAYEKEKLRAEALKQMQAELGPMREIVRTILVEEPVWEIAGVKPEDVKNLFGINAREELPELYKWFAEQPAKVKLEIVKAAMKGLVDERLAAMGTKKQVGTKTTEKTVRERVGREPTPEEVAAKFQTLLREEIRKRNLVELETIKRELEATIAWYQGTPTMNPYFKTGIEMFAEAGSIWLNNPFALAQRAPTFHAALVNWLGHRPEVKKLYDQIQEDLRTGAHQDKRRQRLREMFKRGDEKGMERRRNTLDKPQFLDGVRYELDRVFGPVYRRAKGTALEGSIYKAVGDFRYRAAEQELFLSRENNEVGRLLAENALDWSDFGELLTYRRIVEERYDLANPLGITPKDALEGIERLKATLGPVRYGKLVEAAERFNSLWQQMVVQPLVETGYVSPELADKMQGNTVYATFSVQRAQSEEGINRLLDMAFGAGIGPKIYRQMGTLQEIKNPATAAVLKGLSLISAVHRNTAKREVVKLMREVDPELIREADQNWNGKRHEWVMKDTPHVGTVVVMNAGQPVAYYVPRTIAEALNGADPMESQLAIAAIKANNTLKALYTQLNYGFWPVNLMRDTGSFWLQMPGAAAPLRWAKNLPRAYRAAVSSTKGTPNADAVDALKRLMVISRAEYRGLDAADEHELTLESFGQTPADWDRTAKQQHLLMRAWLKYKEVGQTIERLNKINGMLYLDEHFADKPEWQKRKIVRELAGSPDFLERSGSAVVNWALMFYNPWKEGLHSLKAAAKADPWGFSFKTFAMVMLPAVLQALAASGLFGDERQKQYRSIPDYDLSNYWCIPLGWQNEAQGKVAYLRLPLAEPMRVLNGVVFHSLTDRGQGLAEYGAGQLPGLNSLAKVAMGWGTLLLAGKNPPDPLRGKDVIEPDVFEAGGLPVAQAMGKWTWNELGGGIIHRFRDPQLTDAPQENVEKFLQTPVVSNFLGRWVKVSSRGIDDQDRKLAEPVRQQRAQARVAVREMIRKFEAQEPWGPEERALVNRDAYAAQYLSETLAKVMAQRESLLLRRWEKRESSAERGAVFAPSN